MFTTSLKITFWVFAYIVTCRSILLFTIRRNGSFDILQKNKRMIEKLENFIINELFKKCDQPEKFEKKTVRNCHCIVLLTKFCLFQVQNIFGFANVQYTVASLTWKTFVTRVYYTTIFGLFLWNLMISYRMMYLKFCIIF